MRTPWGSSPGRALGGWACGEGALVPRLDRGVLAVGEEQFREESYGTVAFPIPGGGAEMGEVS